MTQIKTKRFGTIEANEEHFIHMRDGIIGMPSLKKFILVECPTYPLMLWLQSCEDEDIAFPVVEPYFFKSNYQVKMTAADKLCLQLAETDRVKHFSILTIPEEAEDMTINLKAPIVVNLSKASGAQVVLQDKELEVRHPAWNAYSTALEQISSFDEEKEGAQEQWKPIRILEDSKPRLAGV